MVNVMSGKMCSTSNSVIQAQKLVDQLRVEAGMERIKVCEKQYQLNNNYLHH